jgi:preprotein translocase subunit YajC
MTRHQAPVPDDRPGAGPGFLVTAINRKDAPKMGITILAAADAAKKSSSSYLPLLIIVVLFGLFYMTIIRPQRNRQRQAAQTQNQVMPGQRVRTTSGIYGTVVSGDDRDVVVEIAPGVQVQMLRRAVMDVVPEDDQAGTNTSQPTPETGADDDSKSADDRGDLTI